MQFLLGPQFGTKSDVLDVLLDKGMVMVHLDASLDGVQVPARHKGDLHLRLNFSHRFQIPDFTYDEASVRASLSFGGRDFFCVLPWDAVFAMTSHVEPLGYVWPDDLPAELAEQAAQMARAVVARQAAEEVRTQMSVIEGGGEPEGSQPSPMPSMTTNDPSGDEAAEPDPDEGEAAAESGEERRYGHLRVVK